jgi:TolA-binding protein
VYPDERVVRFIEENFVPVKIHIKENPKGFEQFGAQWTPTMIVADSNGAERYRFEGYLPVDDFLAQLDLGLAKSAFANQNWGEAERRFRDVADRFPKTEAAAEALYWAGVSGYKGSGDAAALRQTAEAFRSRYPESQWAKKASVWAA